MTDRRSTGAPEGGDDPGILDDESVDAASTDLLGLSTAHVHVELPLSDDDADDEVVDDAPIDDAPFDEELVLEEDPAALVAAPGDIGVIHDDRGFPDIIIELPADADDQDDDGSEEEVPEAEVEAEVDVEFEPEPEFEPEAEPETELVPEIEPEEEIVVEQAQPSLEDDAAEADPEDADEADDADEDPEPEVVDRSAVDRSAAAREELERKAFEARRAFEDVFTGAAADPIDEPEAAPAQDLEPRMSADTVSEADRIVDAEEAGAEAEATVTEESMSLTAAKRIGDLGEQSRESADLLTEDRLLDAHRIPRPEPEGVWRGFVYRLSGGRINLGDSRPVRARKELTARIAAPLHGGTRFVPVLSRKGGVGKTTITTLLGMALADAREDRVIAIDANPDRGTLADRITRHNGSTVRDLIRARERVTGFQVVSEVVSRDTTRLDVLASETAPEVAVPFDDADYEQVADIAAQFYSVVLSDTGTGIVHDVMRATLGRADALVIVAGLGVDEARLASETLTWLEANGHGRLAREAVVVLNQSSPGTPLVRPEELERHFATRVRHVVRMPYDPHIATGSAIRYADLQSATRLAARELAALVVGDLRAGVR